MACRARGLGFQRLRVTDGQDAEGERAWPCGSTSGKGLFGDARIQLRAYDPVTSSAGTSEHRLAVPLTGVGARIDL
ncbi:hypothetical protein GNZ18_20195 [Actinomadura sp. NEAU-AAG5]|uniref:Uncharacterized protein n=1 Tax=Actinomadura litoris TaxID=2678616 RepID=A0A7K1L3A6_9ACTN|nr:hypothetical protein [Actinomadura litoris]